MKIRPRLIGWIAADSMTAEQAAEAAIVKSQGFAGRVVIHMDRLTGRLTLAAIDAPIPANTFVRGVAFNSDPDLLADDLRSEALEHRLIPGYAGTHAKSARRVA